ncbi:MAG: DUF2020 domain-containing protein [Pseudonocardiaceae bacterium]|nr:DUF2020 domain-containing protein [Pseudonocardiaceae bacterium]
MIARLLVAAAVIATVVPGCGAPGGSGAAASPGSPAPVVAPSPPEPAAEGPCPYLDERAVEQANGQRVGGVRISADLPYPACFFERSAGSLQLRTWIVEGTPEVARAAVDAAAPVATSDLAELPGGWSGGSQPTADGAVFAVAEQGTAVIVTTNQDHTIKARRIAEQVIANLDL